jgi:HlyD family secretion protein
MQFHFSKKLLSIIIAIIPVWIGIWWYYNHREVTISADAIVSASTGTVNESLTVLGEVSRINTQTLYFGTSGKIKKINTSEWSKIKAGDILAELDTKSVDASLRDQKLALENARLQLQKLQSPAKKQDVLQVDKQKIDAQSQALLLAQKKKDTTLNNDKEVANVDAKILDLKNQSNLLKEKIALAEANGSTIIDQAQDTLDRDKKALEQVINRLQTSVDTLSLSWNQITADVDQIYGLDIYTDAKSKNEIFVSGRSSSLRQQVKDGYTARTQIIDRLNRSKLLLVWSSTRLQIDKAQGDISAIADEMYDFLSISLRGIDLSITDATFTDTILSGYKSRLNTHASSLSSRIQSLQTDKQSLIALQNQDLLSKNTDIKSSDNKVTLVELKNTSDKLLADIRSQELQRQSLLRQKIINNQDIDAQIVTLQKTGEIAQATKSDLLNGPDTTDIALQKNAIARAQATLDRQMSDRDNLLIRAPFSGVVDKIDFRVGDMTNATKGISISSPGMVSVKAKIDQVDIVKVRLWNSANIRFDAYPGKIFTWSVAAVESAPENKNGVILYETTLSLNAGDLVFLNGMTAEIEIVHNDHKQAFLIPSASVSQSGGVYIVQILRVPSRGPGEYSSDEVREVNVVLGKNSGDKVEVISWIMMDDLILLKNISFEWDASSSIFGKQPERDNSQSVRNIN